MFAILRKEINAFFSSIIGYLVIALFLTINGLFLWLFNGEFNILDNGFADLSSFFTIAPWVLLFLIPAICMRAFSEEKKMGTLELLKTLANAMDSPYYKINTEQRQTLPLAAVFVNNFTNQMYRIGHEISDIKNINFDILKPLILETAKKVQNISPYMAQTGPAKRNDKKTIKRHLKALDNSMHKDIYELLTKSIKQTHGKKL